MSVADRSGCAVPRAAPYAPSHLRHQAFKPCGVGRPSALPCRRRDAEARDEALKVAGAGLRDDLPQAVRRDAEVLRQLLAGTFQVGLPREVAEHLEQPITARGDRLARIAVASVRMIRTRRRHPLRLLRLSDAALQRRQCVPQLHVQQPLRICRQRQLQRLRGRGTRLRRLHPRQQRFTRPLDLTQHLLMPVILQPRRRPTGPRARPTLIQPSRRSPVTALP